MGEKKKEITNCTLPCSLDKSVCRLHVLVPARYCSPSEIPLVELVELAELYAESHTSQSLSPFAAEEQITKSYIYENWHLKPSQIILMNRQMIQNYWKRKKTIFEITKKDFFNLFLTDLYLLSIHIYILINQRF